MKEAAGDRYGLQAQTKPQIFIIIMYMHHALINALSAHVIHINLNMIFYTHVEHSPTNFFYIKYYKKIIKRKRTTNTHTHNDCSRNWVLVLVRMEILWEEEGFQVGISISCPMGTSHLAGYHVLCVHMQSPHTGPWRRPAHSYMH